TDTPDRRLRYRPGAALARTVRLRDGTCRHPGCTVPADYCDLDHLVPFDHSDPATGGHTEECNLGCFCRRHHRFKHSSGWRYTTDPDGTLHVTTPEGHHISTHPSGPLATHRRDLARTEHARWHTQTHWEHHHLRPTGTPPAEPTLWPRRTQRTRTDRHANTRHRTRPTPPAPAPPPPPPPPGHGPDAPTPAARARPRPPPRPPPSRHPPQRRQLPRPRRPPARRTPRQPPRLASRELPVRRRPAGHLSGSRADEAAADLLRQQRE